MAVTLSYVLNNFVDFTPDTQDVANVAMTGLADGGFFAVADDGFSTSSGERLSGLALGGQNSGTMGASNVAAAQLLNGNIVVVGEASGEVNFRVIDAAGGFPVGFTAIGDTDTSNADVTALQNGGFAVVYQDDFGTDTDLDLRIYNELGVQQFSTVVSASVGGVSERNGAVATLDNGNIVVTWEETNGANTQIWMSIYSQTGTLILDDTLVDSAGSVNRDPQVVATATGFAIFYEDNGWGTGNDITMATFTSAGTFVDFFNVSNQAFADNGDENDVQVTRLKDGNLAVSYDSVGTLSTGILVRILREDGSVISNAVGVNGLSNALISSEFESDLAMAGQSGVAVAFDTTSVGIEGARFDVRVQHTSNAAVDIISGGQMLDDFFGGAEDTVSYLGSAQGVNVNLISGTGFGGDSDGDTYTGISQVWGSGQSDLLRGNSGNNFLKGAGGADELIGNEGNDSLLGQAGVDTLFGGIGVDRLDGGANADIMEGGLGSDFYYVDDVGDLVQGEVGFASGGGIDTVFTSINYTAPTNVEFIRQLAGAGNINATGNDGPGTIVGNEGNNRLEGRGGNDQINGNNGDDVLVGGEGLDTLVGGNGADDFIYNSVSNSRAGAANRDLINGFTRGAVQDTIDLSGVDANSLVAGNQAFAFIGNAAFDGFGSISAGQLRVLQLGGPNACIVEGDINGDGTADLQIFVNLQTNMVVGDFVL
jgi:hypothetical protein